MKWHCPKRKCILVIMVLSVLYLGGCDLLKAREQVVKNYLAMGTVVGVNLYAEDRQQGENVQKMIEKCLTDLENQHLSYRAEGSEIWQVNHSNGEKVLLSDLLYESLQKVWELSEKSDGALDVTVGEITGLWNLDKSTDAPEKFVIPAEKDLKEVLKNVGYEKIVIEQKLALPVGMTIDLGAVGKGIACDLIKEILEEEEVPAAVVSVGGSNLLWGKKDSGQDWLVGVAHPRKDGAYLGYLRVSDSCFIATSGDYERFVLVGDERYHHIVDPHTGYPAKSGLCGVTIVSNSGLLCDALSTACFVLGKEKGMKLARECGAEALFVEENGNITMTEGMKKLWFKSE